ncbi:MAG: hypothetical protein IRZ04_18515 [Rhodospirillales bacterium]|nr:hypothetical protein [Rhodospirillales bacterium]
MKPPSSPSCFTNAPDPTRRGHADREEMLSLLNELLEAERAGAKVTLRLSREANDPAVDAALQAVAIDEARFCTMLCLQIERLGEAPTKKTGDFYQKVMALDGMDARLRLLDRGQGWVVRKIREVLPRIVDGALRKDLGDMLATHERNIEACKRLSARGR